MSSRLHDEDVSVCMRNCLGERGEGQRTRQPAGHRLVARPANRQLVAAPAPAPSPVAAALLSAYDFAPGWYQPATSRRATCFPGQHCLAESPPRALVDARRRTLRYPYREGPAGAVPREGHRAGCPPALLPVQHCQTEPARCSHWLLVRVRLYVRRRTSLAAKPSPDTCRCSPVSRRRCTGRHCGRRARPRAGRRRAPGLVL